MNLHHDKIDKVIAERGEELDAGSHDGAPNQQVWQGPDLWTHGDTYYVKCPTCGTWLDLHRDAWFGDGDLQYCEAHVLRDGIRIYYAIP